MSTTSQTSDSLHSRESFSTDFTEVNNWIASWKVRYFDRLPICTLSFSASFQFDQRSVSKSSTFSFRPLSSSLYAIVNSPSRMNKDEIIAFFFLLLLRCRREFLSKENFLTSIVRPSARARAIEHCHSSVDCTSEFISLLRTFQINYERSTSRFQHLCFR